MFCTRCGARLVDSPRFCTGCGQATFVAEAAGAQAHVPPVAPAPKRLRLIKSQKKIAGVCAGFAEYFGTDVTVMRIIWVALALLPPNIGIIAYIVAWAVLPKE